jgi:nucleotide-binding universal stress UspA family protein
LVQTAQRAVQVRRILVPLTLAPLGEAKLPFAESLARTYGAEMVLLHVLRRTSRDDEDASPEEERAAAYLEMLAAPLHACGVHAHGIVRVGANVADAIVAEAREQQADLIVLGADVRRGVDRALHGSVADEVSRRAHCPVLLVQPDVDAGTAAAVRSFDADAARHGPMARWSLGLRTVEIARIVGSVGRAAELGASFRPADPSREDQDRYNGVLRRMRGEASLPPVQLYKLGSAFYVLDGNHRIAAAKQLGQVEIDAEVTEFVPLGDADAQRAFVKRRRFEQVTGLTRIGQAHHSSTYARLAGMVRRFAAENKIGDVRTAAGRWYRQHYVPLASEIRRRGLLRRFPGAQVADIVVMVDAFRQSALERDIPLPWDEAVACFSQYRAAGVSSHHA